jgi:hypothetical protein
LLVRYREAQGSAYPDRWPRGHSHYALDEILEMPKLRSFLEERARDPGRRALFTLSAVGALTELWKKSTPIVGLDHMTVFHDIQKKAPDDPKGVLVEHD